MWANNIVRHTSSHSKPKSAEQNEGSQSHDEEERSKKEDESQKSKNLSTLKGYYVVEKILDKRKDEEGWKYKIKWMGYPKNQCTWEPIVNLYDSANSVESGVPLMIKEFEKNYEKTKTKKKLAEKERNGNKYSKLSSVSHKVEEISISSRNKSEKSLEVQEAEERSDLSQRNQRKSSYEEKHKIQSNIKSNKKETQISQSSKKYEISEGGSKFKSTKKHDLRNSEDKNENSKPFRAFKENEKKNSRNFKGEAEQISSKNRKLISRSKEFLQSKRRKEVSSSFSISSHKSEKAKETKNVYNKRKREEENRLSSEESNHGYKKKLILESQSEKSEKSQLNQSYKSKPISNKQNEKKVVPVEKQPKTQKAIKSEDSSQYKYTNTINKAIPGVIPKEKGNFIYGDKAKAIVSAKLEGDEILCQIEWLPRNDGIQPKNSYFSNTFIKEYDPLLLVNYYETKIKLPDNKNQKIKTSPRTKKQKNENKLEENKAEKLIPQDIEQKDSETKEHPENQESERVPIEYPSNNNNSMKSNKPEYELNGDSKISIAKLMEIEKKQENKNNDEFLAPSDINNNKILDYFSETIINPNQIQSQEIQNNEPQTQKKIKLDSILAELHTHSIINNNN